MDMKCTHHESKDEHDRARDEEHEVPVRPALVPVADEENPCRDTIHDGERPEKKRLQKERNKTRGQGRASDGQLKQG